MIKTGRPSLNLTPEEKRARILQQAKECKQRRVQLVAQLRDAGQAMCHERHCITPATHNGLCAKHAGLENRRPEKKICVKCGAIPMPGSSLCGFCDELVQEQRLESRKQNKANRIAKIREGMNANV